MSNPRPVAYPGLIVVQSRGIENIWGDTLGFATRMQDLRPEATHMDRLAVAPWALLCRRGTNNLQGLNFNVRREKPRDVMRLANEEKTNPIGWQSFGDSPSNVRISLGE